MVLMLKDWVNADTRADDPNMSILEKQYIYINIHKLYLVGGLEHGYDDFPSIGNVIIPTDELIFF